MDSIGATNEPGAGIVECAIDDGSPVSERLDGTADRGYSVGNVFISGRVDGVAVTYRQPSIAKV